MTLKYLFEFLFIIILYKTSIDRIPQFLSGATEHNIILYISIDDDLKVRMISGSIYINYVYLLLLQCMYIPWYKI